MDLKKLLNKEQYEAATTIQGQLLILAGAGSGYHDICVRKDKS